MTEQKKKSRIQLSVIVILFIVGLSNYARLPHAGVRTVDFVQILALGMLLGILLVKTIQAVKGGNS